MRRRVLLVGEDFGHSDQRYHSDRYALTGSSGRRLAALAGLEFPSGYVRAFDRTNVVDGPDDWGDREAVVAGRTRVLVLAVKYERVILLGRRVAVTFGVNDREVLEWWPWRTAESGAIVSSNAQIARLPHPSGRSRWWNEAPNVRLAETFLRETVAWLET